MANYAPRNRLQTSTQLATPERQALEATIQHVENMANMDHANMQDKAHSMLENQTDQFMTMKWLKHKGAMEQR